MIDKEELENIIHEYLKDNLEVVVSSDYKGLQGTDAVNVEISLWLGDKEIDSDSITVRDY